jgi:hypothetical protein
VLFYVLFVSKCVLPSGDNPVAVNKYIEISKSRIMNWGGGHVVRKGEMRGVYRFVEET